MSTKNKPQVRARNGRFGLARERRPLTRDQALKKLRLKPSDILAERDAGPEFIFVTKNGMKVRVNKIA